MASENLNGVKVAILVEDGFEQIELVGASGSAQRSWRRDTNCLAKKSMCARLEFHGLG